MNKGLLSVRNRRNSNFSGKRKEKSMKLETDRLILRSIQRGDEKIFAKMAIDGSLQQVENADRTC